MLGSFYQEGRTRDFTPNADVVEGQFVFEGTIGGLASTDIKAGELGAMTVKGVAKLPKAAPLVIDAGDSVYFDLADDEVNKDASGNLAIGRAMYAAASADEYVYVDLNVFN